MLLVFNVTSKNGKALKFIMTSILGEQFSQILLTTPTDSLLTIFVPGRGGIFHTAAFLEATLAIKPDKENFKPRWQYSRSEVMRVSP